MCSASATAEQNQSEAKIDAAPFLRVRRAVDSSLPLSQAPFGRDFRESWFGTSMNWMELAPNTRPMPTIVVVAVEAAEMQYDSIETSEIS